ncbi:MAG: PD40 domain-containing protein [Muribaculaceae bacterium]|nr:PD40 domain-containing protein [Muribaculaceae bacterium]
MKKLSLAITALSAVFLMQAQVLQVASIERINTPQSEATAVVAGISPDGDYLLLTSDTQTGLVKFDLATQAATTLTTAERAGWNVRFSGDGKDIIYEEASTTADRLRVRALKTLNVATKQAKTLIEPTRDMKAVEVYNKTAPIIADKTTRKGAKGTVSTQAKKPEVFNEMFNLYVTTADGNTQLFAPNGEGLTYHWASISPDGTKMVYYVSELLGCFVCNLEGGQPIAMGDITAPQWYDNNTIIGMNDRDNGSYVVESTIVAHTLDGKSQSLTDDSVIAMYPYASKEGSKIAFSTPTGEAYIINVNK